MIEKMFPQTVSNIIDYDAIKAAAKKYVEDVFVEIVKSFGDNLILQTMDEAHLSEVSKHVAGDSGLSVEDLLSYMNTDNIYRESEFVSDLLTAFPSGVEYLEFEVTGWKFPQVDFLPFDDPDRSYNYDGTPVSGAGDDVWMDNAFNGDYVNNLLLSRYKGQFGPNNELDWHKKSGRRSSWGDAETWMTTGGFGKPASIHINVDEERTVLEENGLSSVENWLGTVADKLPINLYIEINDIFKTNGEDTAGSTNGYRQSFPYAEGEGFCTNDPAMAVSPDLATVTYTVSYANTQLPDVQIELPESEIVEDGYSIILPTMTGEYESGGKTWKPSAWDVGEFGDSYTPSADTVAHLIFEEVETYEEITLYMASGNKTTQNLITSSFTGNVNSVAVTKLFYNAECTDPFAYDYASEYEVGRYIDGVWTPRVNRVIDMPSSTVPQLASAAFGFMLYDTGGVWIFTNFSGTWLYNGNPIVVRIYPKDQSLNHHVGYFYSSDAYGNRSGNLTQWPIYTAPGTSTLMTYFGNTTIVGLYGSAGNPVALTAEDILTYYQQDSTWRTFRFKPTPQRTMAIRSIVFTTPKPMEIDIDVNFGDPVTIPAGYTVESVKCSRLYLKASKVIYPTIGSPVGFEFLGEAEYCDDTNISLVGKGVSPCLAIFACVSSNKTGFHVSYWSALSPSVEPSYVSTSNLNDGGYFVRGEVQFPSADTDYSVANGLMAWPALFRLYDANSVLVQYHFKIQGSLWQFQNGVFSWVGNVEAPGDLAYWYNGQGVRVHCVKI